MPMVCSTNPDLMIPRTSLRPRENSIDGILLRMQSLHRMELNGLIIIEGKLNSLGYLRDDNAVWCIINHCESYGSFNCYKQNSARWHFT